MTMTVILRMMMMMMMINDCIHIIICHIIIALRLLFRDANGHFLLLNVTQWSPWSFDCVPLLLLSALLRAIVTVLVCFKIQDSRVTGGDMLMCDEWTWTVCSLIRFCSLDVLDSRVGHTMDVLSPFISVLCYSGARFTKYLTINLGNS